MTAVNSRYTRLWVNEFDFSGISNSLEVAITNQREETTCFQDTGKVFTNTDQEATITQQGYFQNAGAGEFEQEMYESIANNEALYLAALFGTHVAACPAYVARTTRTLELPIKAAIGGLITVGGQWFNGVGISRGLRAYAGTISATGAQTYIDMATVGAGAGFAWLFVQAKTGTITNATITVQCDDNTGFGSPATKGTFTFSAIGAYEIALSGGLERYVRINCTSMGGATNFTVGVIVAAQGVTY